MDVVILTNPGDFHSVVVAAALRQKGAPVSLWHTTHLPSCQLGAIWLENGAFTWEVGGPDLDLHSLSPRAFWLRRPEAAVLPTDLDPADRKVALQECRHFFAGLLRGVGMGSYCVNPIGSYGRASLKVEQLKAALSCGFQIPPTLFSNQQKRIRSFVRQHEAIYTAFAPVSWSLEDGVAVLFSTPVTEADLPEDAILMAVPGIFQAKVPKAYELRITAIGQHLFAARL